MQQQEFCKVNVHSLFSYSSILSATKWSCGRMKTTCWVCVGLMDVWVWSWYLLMSSYLSWSFDFCVYFFYKKTHPCNFCIVWSVLVIILNFHSWEQMGSNKVCEMRFFCRAAKPMWWRWDYFGRNLCFVNQLLHSWFYNYFVDMRM